MPFSGRGLRIQTRTFYTHGYLIYFHAQVTTAGVACITGLSKLTTLHLGSSHIADDTLPLFARFLCLKTLSLTRNAQLQTEGFNLVCGLFFKHVHVCDCAQIEWFGLALIWCVIYFFILSICLCVTESCVIFILCEQRGSNNTRNDFLIHFSFYLIVSFPHSLFLLSF